MSQEDEVISLISAKTVELVTKGYTLAQADAAIKRARGWATQMAAKLGPEIRDRAFLDFFRSSLNESEDWLSNMKRSMTDTMGIHRRP